MPVPSSAAVYARISEDREGLALGVGRQVKDCQDLADQLGWSVAEVYVDNDVSAYNGDHRPAFERMLSDLAEGRRDGLLAYDSDRVLRKPLEGERLLEILAAAKVTRLRFVTSGEVNPSDDEGLATLRFRTAMAAKESAGIRRRVKRKHDELAAEGRPNGGERPFGYEADRVTVRESEAQVVRQIVARYLAGESIRSIAYWLQHEGVKTARGGQWRGRTVKSLVTSPRIAGLRVHRGEVVGPACWPAIISEETHRRVLALAEQRTVTRERSPRSYLLTRLTRCGKCGAALRSATRESGTRVYRCMKGPERDGCGGIQVVAEPLEALIAEAVLYRLDTPEMQAALRGELAKDVETSALSEDAANDRQQLHDLSLLYADRKIGSQEWIAARDAIAERLRATERELARRSRNETLVSSVGQGAVLRAGWSALNLTRQHAIVKSVIDHVIVRPGVPGIQHFDPARIDIRWRL